jgi:hypothetical protein
MNRLGSYPSYLSQSARADHERTNGPTLMPFFERQALRQGRRVRRRRTGKNHFGGQALGDRYRDRVTGMS